jgi:multisubunit Na+/H+ antiporter MnhC subunit
MIITGIVVAVAATALALALMLKLTGETGKAVLPGRKKEENP